MIKKIRSLKMFLFLLFLPFAVWTSDLFSRESQNLIRNPSMEEMKINGFPKEWESYHNGQLKGVFHFRDSTAHSGNSSLKIQCNLPNFSDRNFMMWRQNKLEKALLHYKPGTRMRLSLWALTDTPSVMFRFYIEMSRDKKVFASFNSGPQTIVVNWKKISFDFVMPEISPDAAFLALQLLSPGNVWFDDVHLGRAPIESVKSDVFDNSAFCRIQEMPPKQTYLWPDRPKTFLLEWHLTSPKNNRLQIQLRKLPGEKLISETAWDNLPESGERSLSVPGLPFGTYRIDYIANGFKSSDFFRIARPSDKGVSFDAQGRMSINGKKFFPRLITCPEISGEAFKIYQKAGFNSLAFFHLTEKDETLCSLIGDSAAQNGLAVVSWSNWGDKQKLSDREFSDRVLRSIRNARRLTNFIGWLDDESELREIPLASMKRAYQEFFLHAPEFILWQNHAPRMTNKSGILWTPQNVRRYSDLADVVGTDIYPVPENGKHSNLENRTISCVGEYTDIVKKNASPWKPVWMILQGWSWNETGNAGPSELRPRPTYEQFRFMFYNAITHGATGIAYFSQTTLRKLYDPFLAMLADVNHEFIAMEHFFTEGEKMIPETAEQNGEIRLELRRHGDELLIVAVNESKKPQRTVIKLPRMIPLFFSPCGNPVKYTGNTVELSLAPNEVKICSTKKIVIPKHDPFTEADTHGIDASAFKTWKTAGQWLTHPLLAGTPNKVTFARRKFTLMEIPDQAILRFGADDFVTITLNDKIVGATQSYSPHTYYQINLTDFLRTGENELLFELHNVNGPSGLVFEIDAGKNKTFLLSDEKTVFSDASRCEWKSPRLMGIPPTQPWGALSILRPLKNVQQENGKERKSYVGGRAEERSGRSVSQ